MQKHTQLTRVPDLGSDFISRAQTTRRKADEAQGEVQRLKVHLGKLQGQLLECKVSPALLTHGERIDQLHQDLGAYRGRKQSRTSLRARLSGLEPVIRAGMKNLQLEGELESLDKHRVSSAARLASKEAAEALQSALEKQYTTASRAESLKGQINGEEAELHSLPVTNLEGIRDALSVAAQATDADRTLATSESEVKRLTRETTCQHGLVIGAPADFDATASLPVPSSATIRRYRDEMDGIQRRIQDQGQEVEETKGRTETVQGELARLQRQGELRGQQSVART